MLPAALIAWAAFGGLLFQNVDVFHRHPLAFGLCWIAGGAWIGFAAASGSAREGAKAAALWLKIVAGLIAIAAVAVAALTLLDYLLRAQG